MGAWETTMKATRWIIATFVLALAAQASAASPIEQLKGRWAFNLASDPAKTKCARVEGALLKAFESKPYTCTLTEVTNTSTGAAAVECVRTHPNKDYAIFRTKALCEAERLQQVSNGD
jgi:hypothetical protein